MFFIEDLYELDAATQYAPMVYGTPAAASQDTTNPRL